MQEQAAVGLGHALSRDRIEDRSDRRSHRYIVGVVLGALNRLLMHEGLYLLEVSRRGLVELVLLLGLHVL